LRDVYTDLGPAAAANHGDLVFECVAMEFPTSADANRFFQSFEYLRTQAGSLVTKDKVPVPGATASVGYVEQQQAFSGYQISSTTVDEAAAQLGDQFYDVSVAGPAPQLATASRYLTQLVKAK
jgi:hypothetical protein